MSTYDRELAVGVLHYAGGHGFPITIPAGTRVRVADEYDAMHGYVHLRNDRYTFGIRRADLDRVAPITPE